MPFREAEVLISLWAVLVGGSDLAWRRIPNYLVFGASGIALFVLAWSGLTPLGDSPLALLAGLALALLLTIPAYLAKQLGAGDAKLLLAIACLGGISLTLEAFVIGALLAGMAALFWIRFASRLGWNAKVGQRFLPFGTALAIGVVASLYFGRLELWQ